MNLNSWKNLFIYTRKVTSVLMTVGIEHCSYFNSVTISNLVANFYKKMSWSRNNIDICFNVCLREIYQIGVKIHTSFTTAEKAGFFFTFPDVSKIQCYHSTR